jgi:predicted ester cyclase
MKISFRKPQIEMKTSMPSLRRANDLTTHIQLVCAVILCLTSFVPPTFAEEAALVQPRTMILDQSLSKVQMDAQVLAARRYDTFWNTGNEALARAALAPDFTDRTLPPGRSQGLAGPLAASKTVRAAIPDINCDVEQMIVAGDRVVVHLRFRGHFTGPFKDMRGHGQAIDFIATDIYRVANGQITDNWHLEDNLTFLQQLGLIKE